MAYVSGDSFRGLVGAGLVNRGAPRAIIFWDRYVPSGIRGGAVGALEPGLALAYMRQVSDEIESLDVDVSHLVPPPPLSFLGPWTTFLDDPAPDDGDVPPKGWREWFHAHSSLASRLSSDSLITRAGEFERAYADFYKAFVALGGTPSRALPGEPGRPSADLIAAARTGDDPGAMLSGLLGKAALVGAVLLGGYALVTVLPVLLARKAAA